MQSAIPHDDSKTLSIHTFQPLFSNISLFFVLALLLTLSAFTIHFEANYPGFFFNASSIELLQESYLLISATVFYLIGARDQSQRPFAFLVAAFFSVMLIRELDEVLDYIAHGFWKYPAWAVAVVAICYATSNLNKTLTSLNAYFQHRSFGIMLMSVASLLVFSRIFGMNVLWSSLMPGGNHGMVKTFVEEGSELLSYSCLVFASLWYALPQLKKKA
ncbi:hypothetical protein C9I98_04555 [Photobacterium sanctipauli]|uniref:Uncharacterized protein n=1 Tax=Photobacterium sanctipauli TaxID=1342794 RepID=A0A2T3NYE3_9GAMM|nr:hypothetical protein [Photobacterium sanctipauli]PSW21228.1 hypothetical protein C9I98_04555 [Photobacterium sanctipauli]